MLSGVSVLVRSAHSTSEHAEVAEPARQALRAGANHSVGPPRSLARERQRYEPHAAKGFD
jgi:hypothetical protein